MKRILSKSAQVDIEIEQGIKKTFTVHEVRPYDVLAIIEKMGTDSKLTDLAEALLPLCSSLTMEDLKTLYPSDLEIIYEKFKKVNSPFLNACHKTGLWTQLQARVMSIFQEAGIQKAKNELSSLVSG